MLDADEIIPPSLAVRLLQIAASGECDGVAIPFRTFMFGRWIAHSGWGPTSEVHLRFARRNKLLLPEHTHKDASLVAGARMIKLPADEECCIRHYNYLGWDHFVQKLNRYTSLEAQHAIDAKITVQLRSTLRSAAIEVAWRYIRRRGYRDGFTGLLLTLLMVVYRLLVYAKFRQLSEVGGPDDIRAVYRADAESTGVRWRQAG
jgi:hypothetical protein